MLPPVASPSPAASESGYDEYDEREASDGGVPAGLFSSLRDASEYLYELNWDIHVCERTGHLMGYDRATGKAYGGDGNPEIAPEVITAWMMVHDEYGSEPRDSEWSTSGVAVCVLC